MDFAEAWLRSKTCKELDRILTAIGEYGDVVLAIDVPCPGWEATCLPGIRIIETFVTLQSLRTFCEIFDLTMTTEKGLRIRLSPKTGEAWIFCRSVWYTEGTSPS